MTWLAAVTGEGANAGLGMSGGVAASTVTPPGVPACQGMDPDLFCSDREDLRDAAAACARCPVRDWCLGEAKRLGDTYGVRGGCRWLRGRWRPIVRPERLRAAWSLDLPSGLLKAHAAYERGDRSPVAVVGERDYQLNRNRAGRRRTQGVVASPSPRA